MVFAFVVSRLYLAVKELLLVQEVKEVIFPLSRGPRFAVGGRRLAVYRLRTCGRKMYQVLYFLWQLSIGPPPEYGINEFPVLPRTGAIVFFTFDRNPCLLGS